MSTTDDQPKLLARIRKLGKRILDLQAKFDLPKDDPERFNTYGGAMSLQAARIERQGLHGNLTPFKLIATGVSCRDCRHFADVDAPTCWRFGYANPTKRERSNDGDCGPTAELFAHA